MKKKNYEQKLRWLIHQRNPQSGKNTKNMKQENQLKFKIKSKDMRNIEYGGSSMTGPSIQVLEISRT